MDRKFLCDECPKFYSSRQGRWRHKKNEHGTVSSRGKRGGNLETDEFMDKVMQKFKTIENESVEDKTEMEQPQEDEKSRVNNRSHNTAPSIWLRRIMKNRSLVNLIPPKPHQCTMPK